LAAVARVQFHNDDVSFGAWLTQNEITYQRDTRQALISMGLRPEITRSVLEQTNRHSINLIWLREVQPMLKGDETQINANICVDQKDKTLGKDLN
jgi:hypothetical protein